MKAFPLPSRKVSVAKTCGELHQAPPKLAATAPPAPENTSTADAYKQLGIPGLDMAAVSRPRVYLDVNHGTEPLGRLVIELFPDKTPKTCEK